MLNQRMAILLALAAASPVSADEKRLSGAEIEALLPSIVATTETTRQTFSAAGATTYTDRGRDSYGAWRVADGRYCSQWPPAGGWACYDVYLSSDGRVVAWVGDSGRRTENRIAPKPGG